MRGVILILALIALTGCQSKAERASEDDAYCQSLGVPIGSDPYVQCRLAQQQRYEARREAAIRGAQQGLGQMSENFYRNGTPRQFNCTSVRNGETVNTSCY